MRPYYLARDPLNVSPLSGTAPVGIFDSGLGGLSVLRAVRALLPAERLVYVADSRYAPYGQRDDDFIADRTLAIGEWLAAQGAKALVVACNTATAQSIERVRERLSIPLVGVEPGRIDLNRAPLPVLASLPGLGAEALARLAEHRVRGAPVSDVLALSAELSPNARAALVARYADLVRLTTTEPDAWIVTSRARAGQPSITAAIEVRLVRAGTRAAIVRRRTWLE